MFFFSSVVCVAREFCIVRKHSVSYETAYNRFAGDGELTRAHIGYRSFQISLFVLNNGK